MQQGTDMPASSDTDEERLDKALRSISLTPSVTSALRSHASIPRSKDVAVPTATGSEFDPSAYFNIQKEHNLVHYYRTQTEARQNAQAVEADANQPGNRKIRQKPPAMCGSKGGMVEIMSSADPINELSTAFSRKLLVWGGYDPDVELGAADRWDDEGDGVSRLGSGDEFDAGGESAYGFYLDQNGQPLSDKMLKQHEMDMAEGKPVEDEDGEGGNADEAASEADNSVVVAEFFDEEGGSPQQQQQQFQYQYQDHDEYAVGYQVPKGGEQEQEPRLDQGHERWQNDDDDPQLAWEGWMDAAPQEEGEGGEEGQYGCEDEEANVEAETNYCYEEQDPVVQSSVYTVNGSVEGVGGESVTPSEAIPVRSAALTARWKCAVCESINSVDDLTCPECFLSLVPTGLPQHTADDDYDENDEDETDNYYYGQQQMQQQGQGQGYDEAGEGAAPAYDSGYFNDSAFGIDYFVDEESAYQSSYQGGSMYSGQQYDEDAAAGRYNCSVDIGVGRSGVVRRGNN